ncbi:hypothetical protein LTS08_001361 [Lithohypha guttulata]|nr:hypothetical protein LTS08_001361 [Lithohypha guttulata]
MTKGLTTTTILSSILSIPRESPIVPASQRPQSPTNYNQSGWSSPDSWLTKLFRGDPLTILFALLVTLALPVLNHLYFYTQSSRSRKDGQSGDGIPTFLLLGPSGSGKTALVTVLQTRGNVAKSEAKESDEEVDEEEERSRSAVNGHSRDALSPTRLSQIASTTRMRLLPGTPLGSNRYRSENDYEVTASKKEGAVYKIIDTPGHGKLRSEQAISYINKTGIGLKGVIFMLDSSAMDTSAADDGEMAKDTVSYLHDVLLNLQRRPKLVKKAKAEDVRVLVVCNKQDLFTSLPTTAVKSRLEMELERLKASKKRGISAVDAKEDADENEDETVLGGGGEQKFTFKMLDDEFGVTVEIVGGFVKDEEENNDVKRWEEWIGGCL